MEAKSLELQAELFKVGIVGRWKFKVGSLENNFEKNWKAKAIYEINKKLEVGSQLEKI